MSPTSSNRRWPWIVLIFVVAAAIVGVALSSHTKAAADKLPATISVPASQPKTIGEGVTVSGAAVPSNVKAAKAPSAITPPFKSISPKAQPWNVLSITPSGKLAAPMNITFPLSQKVGPNDLVLVAVNHKHTAADWTYVAGKISPDKQHITITITELSWFAPFWEDITGLGNEIKTQFLDGFTGGLLAKAEAPSCPSQTAALKDDYQLSVEAKQTVYSCIDLVNGQRIVKVVNRVKYPVELNHSGMTVKTRGAFSLDLSKLADMGDHVVLEPGDEATFSVTLNHGDKATIDTDVSKLALGLQAVDILAKAILTVLTKVDVQGIASKAEIVSNVLDQKDCLGTLGNLNLGSILANCFSDQMLQSLFNWKAAILGPIMLFISSINLGYAMANAWDDGQKGKTKQNVTVSRPKPNPFASFVLPSPYPWWHVHGSTVQVNSDGTGDLMIELGPCTLTSTEMCRMDAQVSYTANGSSITGTLTAVSYDTWSHQSTPAGVTHDYRVGQQFTLAHQSDPHLTTFTWVGSAASLNGGNANRCDNYAEMRNNTPQYNLCGA